jgi:hypothetical protein
VKCDCFGRTWPWPMSIFRPVVEDGRKFKEVAEIMNGIKVADRKPVKVR